jgi:hypothetical protein
MSMYLDMVWTWKVIGETCLRSECVCPMEFNAYRMASPRLV